MAQLTNLNIAPYYDDYDKNDDFHKVLFRPGYSIQARELTTLQSILQNQIERHGAHLFKEGSVVIPGQLSYSDAYYSVKLSPTFADEQVKLEQYVNEDVPVMLTGETSGVQAKIVGVQVATTTTPPYLFGDIVKAGSDGKQIRFINGENLSASIATTHTSSYDADVASLRTAINDDPNESCVQVGAAVTVEEGVYFIRGQFIRVAKQTLVISPNSNRMSARVGFTVLERLETPERDQSLTDNSTGSANYAAKGAHRLKLRLILRKIPISATAPADFIELMVIRAGNVVKDSKTTEYSVIGDEMARRTYDESGDYTTRPFTLKIEEQIDNDYRGRTYKGAYGVTTGARVITDDNVLAEESLLNVKVSTGKAYVKGYEIEKIGITNKTIHKARSFNTVNAGVSTFNVGNFVNIKNVFGQPDIGNINGETQPYREIGLYTDFTGTRGDATATNGVHTTRGYQIGTARARTMEYGSGTQGSTEAIYKLFLFDVRMFTRLTFSNNFTTAISPSLFANHANGGVQIKGVTSGATGFLYKGLHPVSTNDPQIILTNVVGTFSIGEKVTVSDSAETDDILEDSDNTDLTITEVVNNKFEAVRSVYMSDKDGDTGQNFSADCVLALVDDEGKILLDGTDENALDEFDQMITDGESVVFETERVAKLISPEKNISIFKLPKSTIKTLLTDDNDGSSDTQFTVRRQFIGTTNSSGVVTFQATGSNETFVAFQDKDYMCTVLTAGGGTAVAGDVISLTDKVTGVATSSITITDSTLLGSAAKIKFIATILKTGVTAKTKTTNLCKQLKVLAADDDGAYGIRATDREISLGRADVYRLIAVYDSESTSSDATVPSMTLTSITGTFERGEKIVGASTGAQARIITTTSPMSYSLIGNAGATNFAAGEVITGTASKATATTGVLTAGSKVITSRFLLDNGQRDNYYDIARLIRKRGAPIPLGRLHVVYDYLAHGSGDVFTVDSYSGLSGQMQYDDIPIYTATKVDPDAPEPTGTFPLRDCFDFRPTVEDIAGTSTSVTATDQITTNSFNIHARQYDGTGAVVVDSPKPASSLQADFEYYIGYRASVFLNRSGTFVIRYGVAHEEPKLPKDIADSLKLATINIPPYTFSPLDVKVTPFKTQRYTMRDIGRLKNRIERLEDLTSLTLLERTAESFEIQDQNGLNRFKSGFVVDNFKGHRVGAALDPDYKCAMDIINGELRPKCVMRNVKLIEANTTDADRFANGYVKTGDLLTLPYTNQVMIAQPFATRLENVQPYITTSWIGNLTLSPSGDDWFDTEVAPVINNSVMGDYDTVLAQNQNSIGTFWNAWEIVSVGVSTDTSQAWETSYDTHGYTETLVQTSYDTTTTSKKRTGVTNTMVEDIVYTNNTSISTQIVPFCRSRRISFVGECFMPGKQVYAFFDGVDVNAFCEPLSSDYTNQTFSTAGAAVGAEYSTANQGKNLITSSAGKIEGIFTIPEHSQIGQENVPKFETQKELEFRLTSSPVNAKIGKRGVESGNSTAGQTTYSAVGVLETTQETITGTKNGRIVQTDESQTTSVSETGAAYTTVLDSHYTSTYVPPAPPPAVAPVVTIDDFPTPPPQYDDDSENNGGDLNSGDDFEVVIVDTGPDQGIPDPPTTGGSDKGGGSSATKKPDRGDDRGSSPPPTPAPESNDPYSWTDGPGGGSDGRPGGASSDSSSDGRGSSGGGSSNEKIVCTAMNNAYGFGSFRQAIWLKYAQTNLSKEHEVGYHTIFMPLVNMAYNRENKNNMFLRKILEHIARHRTADIRAETQGRKRDIIGRIERSIFEPLCYIVGKVKLQWRNKW